MKNQNNTTKTYPIHVGASSARPILRRHYQIQKSKRYHTNSTCNNYHHSINPSRSSAKPNTRRAWDTKTSTARSRTV